MHQIAALTVVTTALDGTVLGIELTPVVVSVGDSKPAIIGTTGEEVAS